MPLSCEAVRPAATCRAMLKALGLAWDVKVAKIREEMKEEAA
jgi:hypothetical protein